MLYQFHLQQQLKDLLSFLQQYASLLSHKSGLSIGVLNLIFFLAEYGLPDKSFTFIHFHTTSFDITELFNNLNIVQFSILQYYS